MHYHRVYLGLNMLPSLIFWIACSFVVVDAFIMPHKKSSEEKKELNENWEALDSEEDGQQETEEDDRVVADEDSESDFSKSVYRLAEVVRALEHLNERRSQQEDTYQVADEKRYGGFGGYGGYGRQPHHNLIRARNPDPAKKELYELLRQKEALSQSNSAIRNRVLEDTEEERSRKIIPPFPVDNSSDED